MIKLSAYLFTLGLGVGFGLYLTLNSLTARTVASPFLANVAFFGLGLVTAVALSMIAGNRPADLMRFRDVPWWMLLSGVMSGLMILGSAILIPQVGPGAFFVLFVAGQVVAGTLIGHFGWLGTVQDPVQLRTILGVGCVVVGVWLVSGRS